MVFTSWQFLVFLLLTIGMFFLVAENYRWIVLLIFSMMFYAIAGVEYIPYVIYTALISYFTPIFLEKIREKYEKNKAKRKCKRVIIISLILLLGVLIYTKIANVIVDQLSNTVFEGTLSWDVIIPLGISYYTFSSVGYVLDVYWKRYEAEKNFLRYMLYLLYFPHILQGPIARYDRLGVQFRKPLKYERKRVCFGAQLIIWGFFQKLVMADRLNIFVSKAYSNWEKTSGSILFVATLLYAVQVYVDFCGCVNIAKGISEIFDITIEENFRQPYFSKSVAEFWRRWHITLGAWFKDYLCMPVAVSKPVKNLSKFNRNKIGKQAGKNTVTFCSLIVVWICTGLWHGTGINYVIWGLWQGGIIILSTLLETRFKVWKNKMNIDEQCSTWNYFQIIRTFVLTAIIPRVITRAESMKAAKNIFKKFFMDIKIWELFDGTLYEYGLNAKNFWLAIFTIALLMYVSLLKEHGIQIRERIASKPIGVRWAIYYMAILAVVVFGIYGPEFDVSSFGYMKF